MVSVRVIIFAVALIGVMLSSFAVAAQWFLVDLGDPSEVHFLDLQSLRKEKELLYYWKKAMVTSESDGFRQQFGQQVDSVQTFAVEDCRNGIYKPLYSIVLDAQGKQLGLVHHQTHASGVDPWSKMLEWHQFVCSR